MSTNIILPGPLKDTLSDLKKSLSVFDKLEGPNVMRLIPYSI